MSHERYKYFFDRVPVALWEEDCTELYQSLDALRARGVTDFPAYFDEHPEVVAELAKQVKILDMNQHAIKLYGADSREQLLDSIDKVFAESTVDEFRQNLIRMARGERYIQMEATQRTLDGRLIHILMQSIVLEPIDGRRYALLSIIDLSQRLQMEAELRDVNAELYRSNTELEQFAYVASHDLQEPLRVVSNYAQLIIKRYRSVLDDRGRKYLGYVVDGAQRMQNLIGDLLNLSRIGKRGRALQPVELRLVLDAVLRDIQLMIADAGATVTFGQLPVVLADGDLLVHVLQNLISNGIKFHSDAPPAVHVAAARSGREWIISVSDNGIGIKPEYRESIFKIFKRLHGRSEYPGTGIGLAIVKKIVELHHGRIWIESEPDQGTTFLFTLPAVDEALPADVD